MSEVITDAVKMGISLHQLRMKPVLTPAVNSTDNTYITDVIGNKGDSSEARNPSIAGSSIMSKVNAAVDFIKGAQVVLPYGALGAPVAFKTSVCATIWTHPTPTEVIAELPENFIIDGIYVGGISAAAMGNVRVYTGLAADGEVLLTQAPVAVAANNGIGGFLPLPKLSIPADTRLSVSYAGSATGTANIALVGRFVE